MSRRFHSLCLLLCIGITSCAHACAEEIRYTLTDTSKNVHVDQWTKAGEGWSVSKRTLRGGKQEGVDLITVSNGVIEVDVVPTRGMSIYEIRRGDLRIGWDAPIESLVNPAFVDLESRGGLGWLEGFNEWMVRCGLEFAGHPGTDDEVGRDLTLHGKIGNIPASKVEVVVSNEPHTSVRICGTVHESFFYGPKLELATELVITPGQAGFAIEDTITNHGSMEQEFQIIYHANYGTPLLGEGATVHAAVKSIAPMDDHAAGSIDAYSVYEAPTSGFQEQVYLVEPLAGENGSTSAVLAGANGKLGAAMHWKVEELPYLTIWKNTAALEDGYVTGIEPATGYPYTRAVEREAGRVPTLAAGASRSFRLEVDLLQGAGEVDAAVGAVKKLQGSHSPVIHREPLVSK